VGERRDLRDVPTVTIDAASTTDIDDGSRLPRRPRRRLRVLVSIADVDAFVPDARPSTPRPACADERYLAGRVLHMLPEELSSGRRACPGHRPAPPDRELRIDPEGSPPSTSTRA
jgi:ribonuclease R